MALAEWVWERAGNPKEQQAVYSRALKEKLDKLKITYRIVWEPGPGEETKERVEAVKRWFVHDWQTLDNKIKSSIVEGVSVFLAMFDMPDVAKVFCPAAPHITDDPEAIILQAQLRRIKAEKDAKEAAEAKAKKPEAAEAAEPDDKTPDPAAESNQAATSIPPATGGTAPISQHLPPLFELIEQGKGAGLEHARRYQPGAGPRRGRDAQERISNLIQTSRPSGGLERLYS